MWEPSSPHPLYAGLSLLSHPIIFLNICEYRPRDIKRSSNVNPIILGIIFINNLQYQHIPPQIWGPKLLIMLVFFLDLICLFICFCILTCIHLNGLHWYMVDCRLYDYIFDIGFESIHANVSKGNIYRCSHEYIFLQNQKMMEKLSKSDIICRKRNNRHFRSVPLHNRQKRDV